MKHYIHGGPYDNCEYEMEGYDYRIYSDADEDKDGTVVPWRDFETKYWICSECGDAYYAGYYDYFYAEDTGNTFCEYCENNALYYCDHCGNYYENDTCDHGYDGELCQNCADEESGGLRGYHDSKERDDYDFHMTAAEATECAEYKKNYRRFKPVNYIGFEWEIDGHGSDMGECVHWIEDEFGDFFSPEEDGSVAAEFVSEPATLAYHVQNRDRYAAMARMLRDHGWRAHDCGSCGLHMHVSRDYFGGGRHEDTAIAKILFIMNRHWENIVRFSRRKPGQMHWCNRYDERETAKSIIDKSKQRDWDRYYAVNLSNYNTIEFRLWRGTLNIDTLMATLKFTQRICDLAKEKTAVQLHKMTWKEILGDDPDILAYWARRTGEDYTPDNTEDEGGNA